MFGASLGQSRPAGTSLFPNLGQSNQPQNGTSLFGGLGQNIQQNQQPQQQTSGSVFGGLSQNTQQNQPPQQMGTGIFGSFGQSTQQNQQGGTNMFGRFGQNQQQQQQQQPQTTNMFGQTNQQQTNAFGAPQQPQTSIFGRNHQQTSGQAQENQNSRSLWQPGGGMLPREKNVPDQISTIMQKWDTSSPNCEFRYWFYNQVGESNAIYYTPVVGEDAQAWEDALSKKPGAGYVPVSCSGFRQLGERIAHQHRTLAAINTRLHEIRDSLSHMLRIHDTGTSVRTMEAKRKHTVLRQRCLSLATKVQVLRNRGYALGGNEEDVKAKLQALEKGVFDQGLNSRGDEIWARMTMVQERVDFLKAEFARLPAGSAQSIDEEMAQKAQKLLGDYQTQISHLKKETDHTFQVFTEWEKEQSPNAEVTRDQGW